MLYLRGICEVIEGIMYIYCLIGEWNFVKEDIKLVFVFDLDCLKKFCYCNVIWFLGVKFENKKGVYFIGRIKLFILLYVCYYFQVFDIKMSFIECLF